mmetsp:Transcript_52373/g.47024  ORF Transcript_52373/g.47024 Transcript_52373/m.47024 type:complete len:186 (+) Transcript_52373:63-620(+)
MSNRPPRLTRQQSVERLQESHMEIGLALICVKAPTAIAALIIAGKCEWSSNSCNDGTIYTVDPLIFLYATGIISVVYAILYAISYREGCCNLCLTWLTCPILLFYFAWGIIGLVMYFSEFNSKCQQESIAIMILSWSIIEIGSPFLACFGACWFIFCCECCYWRIHNFFIRRGGRRETDPLLSSV